MACPSDQTFPAAGLYPSDFCGSIGTPSIPFDPNPLNPNCADNTPPPFPNFIAEGGWDTPKVSLQIYTSDVQKTNAYFLPDELMNQKVENQMSIKQGAGSGSYVTGNTKLKPEPFTLNLYFLGDDPTALNLQIHNVIGALEGAVYLRADFSTCYPNAAFFPLNNSFRELWGPGYNIKSLDEGYYLSPYATRYWIQPITLMPKFPKWTNVRTPSQATYDAAFKILV